MRMRKICERHSVTDAECVLCRLEQTFDSTIGATETAPQDAAPEGLWAARFASAESGAEFAGMEEVPDGCVP